MRYFYFQIKFTAGDNYRFWEDHVMAHDGANDESVRELLAEKHLRDSHQEAELDALCLVDPTVSRVFHINGGEVLAEVTKTAELTRREFDIINKYIS